jgi:hypothetical protein
MDIWIIITIISCILSIIFVIIAYFGIIRYMNLRRKNCSYYAEKYLNLPRVTSKGKVVVSMYLRDDDISTNITLKSILDQTVHPDQIIIVTSNKNIQIPEFLRKDSIIVKQHSNNDKSESAFTVPLSTQKDSDTKIIIVTNGIVYGPDFIESLVEESDKSPDNVIFVEGYDAGSYANGKIVKVKNPNFIDVDNGVLIKPKMFKEQIESNSLLDSPSAILSATIGKNKILTTKIDYNEIFHTHSSVKDNEKRMVQHNARYFSL